MNPKLKELKARVEAVAAEAREILLSGDHNLTQVYRALDQAGKDVQRRIHQIESYEAEHGIKPTEPPPPPITAKTGETRAEVEAELAGLSEKQLIAAVKGYKLVLPAGADNDDRRAALLAHWDKEHEVKE